MSEAGGHAEANVVLEISKLLLPVAIAFLAAFLALLANRHIDKGKARRDQVSALSDAFRADVREAATIAAEYWSGSCSAKLVSEARIKMLEQEIRATAVLIDDKSSYKSNEFQSAVTSFLAVLTGADFEAKAVQMNLAHVRDIVGRAVVLRKATSELRRDHLAK
ncbi:hypothetical protein [Brevundimonas sp.]|uniref:hypothetical protein n=1 Tax=Brevundimonas sp. TaxID=1871086 RepID=UPI0026137E21|nr:hypothetical protein [Brevundimonas sp.]